MISQSQCELINKVRTQCRKLDGLDESIDKIHQAQIQSPEDNYEMLLKEYNHEYQLQLKYLSELLTASTHDE